MAENPSYWKKAELVILDALIKYDGVGFSQPHLIALRLREAGLLNDQEEPIIGWEGLRAHRMYETGGGQDDSRGKGQNESPVEVCTNHQDSPQGNRTPDSTA